MHHDLYLNCFTRQVFWAHYSLLKMMQMLKDKMRYIFSFFLCWLMIDFHFDVCVREFGVNSQEEFEQICIQSYAQLNKDESALNDGQIDIQTHYLPCLFGVCKIENIF